MESNFLIQPLSNFCSSIDYGFTTSASDIPSGVQFLRITDIVQDKIDWKSVPFCVATDVEKKKYKLHHDDIVIARTGATTGYSAYIKNPPSSVFASYLVRLKIKPEHNPRFVSYLLKTSYFWEHMQGVLGEKSAQPNASAKTMAEAILPCPPFPTQKAIAHILGTLDDKIELLRQMNETLEAMVRALFKSWFVDFDPVKKKAEGLPTGLPPEIDALFPDSFEDSELGEIPKEWVVDKLSFLCELNAECWSAKNHPSCIKYLDLTSVKNGEIVNIEPYSYEEAPSRARRVLRKYDTIIGTVRPGNRSFSYIDEDGLTGSTGFAVLHPLATYTAEIIYLASTQDEMIDYYTHLADGGAYPAISPNLITSQQIVIASIEVQKAFHIYSMQMVDKFYSNFHDMKLLMMLRDMLLPKLISGELEVKDIDKILEHAT